MGSPITTTVKKNTQGKWLAWCEPCQDGYQGGKRAAQGWADRHDITDRHRLNSERWDDDTPLGGPQP
jgi:hypothetical protein